MAKLTNRTWHLMVRENQSQTYQHELGVHPQVQPKLAATLQADDASEKVNVSNYL